MSYNIRGGLGMDGIRDTSRIADTVRTFAPDAICFQEVHQRLPWSGGIDQPKQLTRMLGGQVVFQKNINTLIGGYGLAIWTRLPVLPVRRWFLPEGRERRGALQVTIEDGKRPLTLFCTHWGLTWDERQRQSARLAELVNQASAPVLVCGDFNDVASAPYIQAFLAATGLADCGAHDDLLTYPSNAPEVRIDFMLAAPELRAGPIQVSTSQASDHLPLWIDLP